MRKRLVSALVLGSAALAAGAPAAPRPLLRPARVHVTPRSGSPTTTFTVTFLAPERTGRVGNSQRGVRLAAYPPRGSSGCILSVDVTAPDARRGHLVRVRLAPSTLRGRWCSGTYHGEILETAGPICPAGTPCPALVVLRGLVGRFAFAVRGSGPSGGPPSGDTAPPAFAGVQRAFACTPGPQRPGQTTPYTLDWQAATDGQTPSSQIVYDVYYSAQPGGENFSKPSWTTAPGVTTFRTPGLPSHGAAYFVVRARDPAGYEDKNTVERAGVDPCY